jgi:hypothetical protein
MLLVNALSASRRRQGAAAGAAGAAGGAAG